MKITQYITTNGLTFQKRPIFPAVNMSSAQKLVASKTPVSSDFLGFGVAITGSSCYNLSLMEPTERRALLESIYTKNGLGLSVGRLSVGSSDQRTR